MSGLDAVVVDQPLLHGDGDVPAGGVDHGLELAAVEALFAGPGAAAVVGVGPFLRTVPPLDDVAPLCAAPPGSRRTAGAVLFPLAAGATMPHQGVAPVLREGLLGGVEGAVREHGRGAHRLGRPFSWG
ncbi:hypothetical protein ACFTXM_39730 [Streptomyces sp. NPDC056930]|uniref:hypothetical protein n=1 Tax=Streptomyces sp. NPDC056930 TaxID=3345967 RepID=UPI00362F39BD